MDKKTLALLGIVLIVVGIQVVSRLGYSFPMGDIRSNGALWRTGPEV
jgi:hypothetical protein